MRTGWGDRELDLPAHPITPWAAARRERLVRAVPRRAAGDPGRRLQGALQRHRLPLPRRDRAHLPVRQPDLRRGAGDRGRRGDAVRPAAARPRHRRVLPRPPVRRALGRPPSVAARDLRLARLETRHIDELPSALAGSGKTRVLRGRRLPGRRRSSPATRRARPGVRPRARPSCGWSRTSGSSASSRPPATSPRSASRTRVREWDRRARARRALDRGHLLPPGPRDGQRHRLRLDRRRRLGTRRRCTGSRTPARSPRASCCCSTWAPRRRRSTPPT